MSLLSNVCECVYVSNQRYSTDLDKEVSFLQVSILQLIRFVGVIKRTDQLVHLQQVILAWRGKHRQDIRTKSLHLQYLQTCHIHVQTQVRQHGGLQAVSEGGRGVMEFQQGVETLLLGCPLHSRAQAHGDGWYHSPQSLDQQHCHHLIRVLEHLALQYR